MCGGGGRDAFRLRVGDSKPVIAICNRCGSGGGYWGKLLTALGVPPAPDTRSGDERRKARDRAVLASLDRAVQPRAPGLDAPPILASGLWNIADPAKRSELGSAWPAAAAAAMRRLHAAVGGWPKGRKIPSGPSRHNLWTRTWVTARNHQRITAPQTRTFNHGAALGVCAVERILA